MSGIPVVITNYTGLREGVPHHEVLLVRRYEWHHHDPFVCTTPEARYRMNRIRSGGILELPTIRTDKDVTLDAWLERLLGPHTTVHPAGLEMAHFIDLAASKRYVALSIASMPVEGAQFPIRDHRAPEWHDPSQIASLLRVYNKQDRIIMPKDHRIAIMHYCADQKPARPVRSLVGVDA